MRQEFIPGPVFDSQQRAAQLTQPQVMTGAVRSLAHPQNLYFGMSTQQSPPLWVILHMQSQAREKCESDSVCIVLVWAGGQFFLLRIALHQDRSNPLC